MRLTPIETFTPEPIPDGYKGPYTLGFNQRSKFLESIKEPLTRLDGQPWQLREVHHGDNERYMGHVQLQCATQPELVIDCRQPFNSGKPDACTISGMGISGEFTFGTGEKVQTTRQQFTVSESIGMSMHKSPEAAAKDIKARLLPALRAKLAEAQARRDSWLKNLEASEAGGRTICLLMTRHWQHAHTGRPTYSGDFKGNGYDVEAKNREYDEAIETKITCSPAKFAALLQFLKGEA